jgi:tellurite resistance protein
MALSEEDTFNLEVLKLLLFIASIDGEVGPNEAQFVRGLGRSWSVHEPSLKALLEDGQPGEPNWKLLKPRSDEALIAARSMVLSDGVVNADESMILKRVVALLAA